jgi:hypothetical protein
MKKLIVSLIVTGAAVFSLLVMTPLGCSSPDQLGAGGHSGGGNAGSPVFNLDASAIVRGGSGGGDGPSGQTPTDDANCGSKTKSTTKQPADVLLVLDRSGSMDNDIAVECACAGRGGGDVPACSDQNTCKDRWTTVSTAVVTTVSSTPDILWGLKLYSTSGRDTCYVSSTIEVPVAANSAGDIQSIIQSTSPGNNTPTAAAITAATTYLKGVTDQNKKVILLATDGQPNCKSGSDSRTADVEGTLNAIKAAYAAGFLVYVIGIGPSTGNLNDFAIAGGTAAYYPATSPDQLAAALASISTAIASCSFTLDTVPPDVNNVAVYVDKILVPKEPINGWSFGISTQVIELNGSTCEKVKASTTGSVQVLFGCPGQQIPQFIP